MFRASPAPERFFASCVRRSRTVGARTVMPQAGKDWPCIFVVGPSASDVSNSPLWPATSPSLSPCRPDWVFPASYALHILHPCRKVVRCFRHEYSCVTTELAYLWDEQSVLEVGGWGERFQIPSRTTLYRNKHLSIISSTLPPNERFNVKNTRTHVCM